MLPPRRRPEVEELIPYLAEDVEKEDACAILGGVRLSALSVSSEASQGGKQEKDRRA